jgi:hypothetical protein
MTKFIVALSRNENYRLEDDTLLDIIVYLQILKDFDQVETQYYKYKTFIQSKFKNVIEDEDGGGYVSNDATNSKTDPMRMVNDLVKR